MTVLANARIVLPDEIVSGALRLDATPEWVEEKIDELFEMDTEQNPMDFEAFWAWFVKSCEEGPPQGVTKDV